MSGPLRGFDNFLKAFPLSSRAHDTERLFDDSMRISEPAVLLAARNCEGSAVGNLKNLNVFSGGNDWQARFGLRAFGQKNHAKHHFFFLRKLLKPITLYHSLQLIETSENNRDVITQIFLERGFDLPGQIFRACRSGFEDHVSGLLKCADVLASGCAENSHQLSHPDQLVAAYVYAAKECDVGMHVTM